MDLRRFEQFVAIVEQGSFTRAAQQLGMSQSNLSMSITALEREIGVPLLVRERRGVRCTPAGQAFLEPARAAIEQAQRARKAATQGLKRPPLHILEAFVPRAFDVAAAVDALRADDPAQAVEIESFGLADLTGLVASGRADVAVTPLPAAMDGIEAHPLFEADLVVIVPGTHRLAGATGVTAADLRDQTPILLPPQSVANDVFARLFPRKATPRGLAIRTRSWLNALVLVSRGKGVTLGPDFYRDMDVLALRFATLADPPRLRYAVVRRADAAAHPAGGAFIRHYLDITRAAG